MQLKQLPSEHRPREKLLRLGPQTLTDAELLALLLRTGLKGKNVVALSEQLLSTTDGFGSLTALLGASMKELRQTKGLGPAKCAELIAVLELAKRALAEQLRAREVFQSPDSVKQFLRIHLGDKPHEVFGVMFLDAQNRLIAWEEMFRGTLNQASVYPREVVLRGLFHHASAVVLSHNHPSGRVEASRADELMTHSLKSALALVDIRVLNHIIVGPGAATSMAESGLM
jgi:DNA repair protein RadC